MATILTDWHTLDICTMAYFSTLHLQMVICYLRGLVRRVIHMKSWTAPITMTLQAMHSAHHPMTYGTANPDNLMLQMS